ncbi:MAG TPA: hypothetical protein VLZ31_07170 [Microbacteriaceae bacterium]|nr:hypothetical protein [Microbacteriaceae bacterium]
MKNNSKRRRATRPAPPGSDPHPASASLDDQAVEDNPTSWGDGVESNDEQLLLDRPPHWASKDEKD